MSSANNDTGEFTPSLMSFMRIRKRTGPRTVPWGTPLLTSDDLDFALWARMNCFLPVKKLWIRVPNVPQIPILVTQYTNIYLVKCF